MAAVGWLGYARLAFMSQPKHERQLYKQIRRLRVRRIVEVGIGSAQRAVDLVSTAQRYTRDATISYTGFDWFEERESDAEPLPLIHAHRQLQQTGARIRLVPGFPPATVPQLANSLQRTDLLLISHRVADASLERTWFYLPRMCHANSLVLREVSTGDAQYEFALISPAELERRAAQREVLRAA